MIVNHNRTQSCCITFQDGRDMTRELVEIRGRMVKDIRFGGGFIAILTSGKWYLVSHKVKF